MNVSNVIALGAFALSAVGAVIALWQARIASRARADAQQARDGAAAHEDAALAASQRAAGAAERSAGEARRSADALEEANALTRSLIPDDVVVLGRPRVDLWMVRNVSSRVLYAFAILEVGGHSDVTFLDDDNPSDLTPGRGVAFNVTKDITRPTVTTIVASWGSLSTGERDSKEFTVVP